MQGKLGIITKKEMTWCKKNEETNKEAKEYLQEKKRGVITRK